MALGTEMRGVLEQLMNSLLSRKDSFRLIFTKMEPVIHYEAEFFVAFFLGYIAHSYKQLFLILTNRDMQYDEISEVFEFLMRSEPKIRETLVGRRAAEAEIEKVPEEEIEKVPEAEEKIRPPEIVKKVNALELGVTEIQYEINVIKEAVKNEIARYEVKLAKSGKWGFQKSTLR